MGNIEMQALQHPNGRGLCWMDETLYTFHSKPYPKYFLFSFMILLKD